MKDFSEMVVGQFENRMALGRPAITPRKALVVILRVCDFFDLPKKLCPILLDNFRQFPPKAKKITNSTRAPRRIPVLFFHTQKVALIESINPQWREEQRRDLREARDRTDPLPLTYTLGKMSSFDPSLC
jgi:hypothetical protein